MRGAKDRIIEKIKIDEKTGCWNWIACTQSNGYGRFSLSGKSMGSHRASFKIFKGDIPCGMDICHTCDNRKCINPDHLFLGTRKDNMQDAVSKNRQAQGFMLPHTKLTNEQRIDIAKRKCNGESTHDLSMEYGINFKYVEFLSRRFKRGLLKCAV